MSDIDSDDEVQYESDDPEAYDEALLASSSDEDEDLESEDERPLTDDEDVDYVPRHTITSPSITLPPSIRSPVPAAITTVQSPTVRSPVPAAIQQSVRPAMIQPSPAPVVTQPAVRTGLPAIQPLNVQGTKTIVLPSLQNPGVKPAAQSVIAPSPSVTVQQAKPITSLPAAQSVIAPSPSVTVQPVKPITSLPAVKSVVSGSEESEIQTMSNRLPNVSVVGITAPPVAAVASPEVLITRNNGETDDVYEIRRRLTLMLINDKGFSTAEAIKLAILVISKQQTGATYDSLVEETLKLALA